MAGECKENGRGNDAKKDDERKTVLRRRKGRLSLRWMDDVVADLKVKKIKQGIEKVKHRRKCRLIVEEAKAQPGL